MPERLQQAADQQKSRPLEQRVPLREADSTKQMNARYQRDMAIDSDCGMTPQDGLALAAAQFHSLADSVRLSIVQRLSRGEACVVDLTRELGLARLRCAST
ncbi:hypothetical protein GCM10010191_49080 [Actinomadura vinacea]|uniref:HTH arsR-type domain-containing protein n=1 Tax=Actinomadura vinacea TaxID=115336 RepID=A0ABN3JGM7_9ACTN